MSKAVGTQIIPSFGFVTPKARTTLLAKRWYFRATLDTFGFYLAYGAEPPTDMSISFSEMFPYIDESTINLWLRPDSMGPTLNGTESTLWTDLSGNAYHATQNLGDHTPTVSRVGNFPAALEFDGNDFLDVGDLPNTGFSSFVVYRNPSPGSQTWQRTYSAKAPPPSTEQDWQGGLAHIPDNDGSGNMTANNAPHVHTYARNGPRSMQDMVIGGISNEGNAPRNFFTGELYEILLFNDPQDWNTREQIKNDYFAKKYRIDAFGGYANEPDFAATLNPITIKVNGSIVDDFTLDTQGDINLKIPDLGSEATPLSIEITLPDGSTSTLPQPAYYYQTAYDGWRTDVFLSRPGGPLGSTLQLQDADEDGIYNLVEFALKSDPNEAKFR